MLLWGKRDCLWLGNPSRNKMEILRKLSVPQCLSLQSNPSPFCLQGPSPIWASILLPVPEASPSPSWLLVCSSQRQISSLLLRSISLNFLRHLLNALPPPEISYSLLLRESCLRPAVAHVHSAHHLVFPFLQATYCLPDPVVSAEKSALS